MTLYALRYQKPGDRERVKRTAEGRKRRFTRREAKEFLRRNRPNYPNARLVPITAEVSDGRKRSLAPNWSVKGRVVAAVRNGLDIEYRGATPDGERRQHLARPKGYHPRDADEWVGCRVRIQQFGVGTSRYYRVKRLRSREEEDS